MTGGVLALLASMRAFHSNGFLAALGVLGAEYLGG
jgi:hypothetical protein